MKSDFTVLAAVLLCLLGFGVGVFGTLVGAGGGFILTPVLLLVYPQSSPALITAISLIAVFFNAGSGSIAYARQRRIDYRRASCSRSARCPDRCSGCSSRTKSRAPGSM